MQSASVTNNERFVRAGALRFNASAAVPFAQKWRLRAVSRAFYCAWYTKRAWRGTRWHLALCKEGHFPYIPGLALADRWTALLQHIAHLLPDGFLDGIERAYQSQFRALSIDEALAEVRSFGAHVYVETLDVQPLPDGPFTTHLLHEAHHIGVRGHARHMQQFQKIITSLSGFGPNACQQRSHAAHLCARRGGARALFIRQLQRAARPLHAESAQRQHRC